MVEPPPGRFSTTTWPMRLFNSCAINRAMVSIGPPGGQGTIRMIGRSGYFCCAPTGEMSGNPIAATAIAERTLRRVAMTILQGVSSQFLCAAARPKLTPTGGWPLAPKRRARRISQAAVVAQAVGAILGEQQRTVEIDHTRLLREQHGRRHGQRRRHRAADHDAQAALLRCRGERQGLGHAAGLVELAIDGLVSAAAPVAPRLLVHA